MFNKKKLIKLEKENAMLLRENEKLKNANETLKDVLKNNNSSSLLIEENKKLIEWIEKILENIGTIDVYSKDTIKIPVYKERHYISNPTELRETSREVIFIPQIEIIKERNF